MSSTTDGTTRPGDEQPSIEDRLRALEVLAARVDALEAENASLRANLAGTVDGPSGPMVVASSDLAGAAKVDDSEGSGDRSVTRRRLLFGAGAAAAAAGAAVVATATPAAAANGDVMHVGEAHTSTHLTALINTTPTSDLANTIGLQVTSLGPLALTATAGTHGIPSTSTYGAVMGLSDTGPGVMAINQVTPKPAVFGRHGTATTDFVIESGVFGESSDSAGVAGSSISNAGVVGRSSLGSALLASTPTGTGVAIVSGGTAMQFSELDDRADPRSDSKAHVNGEVVYDVDGTLWYCTLAGTPGTWRKLSGDGVAGQFHVLPVPKRIYDSRAGTAPSVGPKTKFAANEVRVLDCKVNGSGVPAGATAVSVTCLLVDAANANGNFTIWANGATKPQANTLVWGGSAARFTTPAISAVDANARVKVSPSQPTNLVIDVVGYYL